MKFKHPWLTDLVGLAASWGVTQWMDTIDYRGAFYDSADDPISPDSDGPKIYLLWHEYMLLPLYLRGRSHMTILLSQHRDAEIMARTARFMGLDCVRGSTYRGASNALRELIRVCRTSNLAITPDGPRGPRRNLSQGPIYLASKLEVPLVLMGFGFEKPWRLKSWDRFAIPRPYSRIRAVLSPAIRLPRKLDRDGLEHYRGEMERSMNRLTSEAEAWAESGTSKVNEIVLRREPVRTPLPTRGERSRAQQNFPAAPHFLTEATAPVVADAQKAEAARKAA